VQEKEIYKGKTIYPHTSDNVTEELNKNNIESSVDDNELDKANVGVRVYYSLGILFLTSILTRGQRKVWR
jgi:hypothetical protein